MMMKMAYISGGKIALSTAMIVKSVLNFCQQIKTVRQFEMYASKPEIPNIKLKISTIHQQRLQVSSLKYCYSEYTKSSEPMTSNQQKQIIKQPRDQQSIIDVNATRSKMLFMDSNRLSQLLRIKKVKRLYQCEEGHINSAQSIFGLSKHDKIQLSSFDQLDRRILNITRYNQYLAKGTFEDYQSYPTIKLTQICLKLLYQHQTQPHSTSKKLPVQHWKSLQHYIRKRMHNCSSKEYLKIVFIVLNAYHSVYKFSNQFIESLISGLKKEIPLLEEHELMQAFLVVSQPFMRQRIDWENSLRFSQSCFGLRFTQSNLGLQNTNHFSLKHSNYKVKSPFFQHQILYQLHQQILQKIVKRYQNKFMNTQLAIKQQQLFKLLWWSQNLIAFRNESIGQIRDNSYSNLAKNKFLVGIVNILTSKLHPQLKKTMTHVIKGQLKQIQNKQIQYSSLNEMIRCFECLGMLRDFLMEEGKSGKIYEGIDEKGKEVRLRADTWIEKSNQVNDIIKSLLENQSVKDLINNLFNPNVEKTFNHNIEKTFNDNPQKTSSDNHQKTSSDNNQKTMGEFNKQHQKQNLQLSLKDYQNKWKLIEIIDESQRHDPKNKSNLSKNWYIRLIKEFKVFELMEKTQQNALISFNKLKSSAQQKILVSDRERMTILGQSQVNLLYSLFNNLSNIKKQLHSIKAIQTIQILNNVNFAYLYSGIVKSCFYSNLFPEEFVYRANQMAHRLMDIIQPNTILNIVNLEISMLKLNEISQTQDHMHSVGLLIAYTQEMIENRQNNHSQFNFLHYIRQLQFPIYNYLTIYQKIFGKSAPDSLITLKTKQISTFILNRNTLSQQYLKQNNIQYQQIVYNQKLNPFTTNPKFISTNNYKALASSHNLTAEKHKLLEGDGLYTKENVLMAEFMMRCVKEEKKNMLMDENIVKLNKFFTQIKAFKEIKFYCPITVFMACPQFIVTLDDKDSRQIKNQMNTNKLVKGLYFLDKNLIMQMQLLSLKQMYSMHGIELTVIEVNEFLDMHINQRIQTLNRAIFGSISQNAANRNSHQLRLEDIISKFC